MARQEQVVSIFVASPSDVADERSILSEVVNEFNMTWCRNLGLRLELVSWETHAYPGIGSDAQDVINSEIPVDYDIFIGVMWCRFGTATGRAESGTAEEFRLAKSRYDTDPSSVRFMMYFNDSAIPPSQLDPEQLSQVNSYRQSLGEQGVLHWSYSGSEHFEKLVRLHLTRQVQGWQVSPVISTNKGDQAESMIGVGNDVVMVEDVDEIGILELVDIAEDRFEQLTFIAQRIAAAITGIGDIMSQRTIQINCLPRDSRGNVNRTAAKRLVSTVASDLADFTSILVVEIPIFSKAQSEGLNALTRASTLSCEFASNEESERQVGEISTAVQKLHRVFEESMESIKKFRNTVAALPRITTELNRSKRGMTIVLDQLINEFNNARILLRDSDLVVRGILVDRGKPNELSDAI